MVTALRGPAAPAARPGAARQPCPARGLVSAADAHKVIRAALVRVMAPRRQVAAGAAAPGGTGTSGGAVALRQDAFDALQVRCALVPGAARNTLNPHTVARSAPAEQLAARLAKAAYRPLPPPAPQGCHVFLAGAQAPVDITSLWSEEERVVLVFGRSMGERGGRVIGWQRGLRHAARLPPMLALRRIGAQLNKFNLPPCSCDAHPANPGHPAG